LKTQRRSVHSSRYPTCHIFGPFFSFLFNRLPDPLIRWFATQPVDHGLIAALLQRGNQSFHLPYAQPQLFGSLPLRDQALLRFA
jgi:hypothetical protein